MSLYPLHFNPIFKHRIWGGTKIKSVLGLYDLDTSKCGEVWLVSGLEDDQSIVSEGFLGENELNELVEIYMGDLVGEKVYEKFGNHFPVLVKFLDSNDALSVQVHPDDTLAQSRHKSYGKHEMWYVLEAEANAYIINGFNKKISKETLQEHIANKTLPDILNKIKPKQGDVFYLPAGRVHALGPGNLVLEIQQTSDITYRLYDWDRVDDKGKPRELHTEQAMDAIDYTWSDINTHSYTNKLNQPVELVNCPFFTVNLLELTGRKERDYHVFDSFVILICIEGECEIEYVDGSTIIKMAETIIIPALFEHIALIPNGACKLVEVYIA